MPLPPAAKLILTDAQRKQLLTISRHRSTPRGIVLRISIVLGAAEGVAKWGACAESIYFSTHSAVVAEAA